MRKIVLFTIFVWIYWFVPSMVSGAVITLENDEPLIRNEAFVADAQRAIDLVYNYEYDASLDILEPWKEIRPDSPIWKFWEGLPVWWEILNDMEDESNDKAFIHLMEQADYQASRILRRNRRDLDALVVKSLANGFLARLHANRASWYKSFSHGRVSVNMVLKLEQQFPDVADFQFGLGLYHYFAAHLTEEYTLVRAVSWMLPGGDKEEGLQRLTLAAESAFMGPESRYFLGHINLHYERDYPKALEYLDGLTTDYPENTFFQRLLLRTYFRNRMYPQAEWLADHLIDLYAESDNYALLEELYYIKGRLHFRANDYEAAENQFEQVIYLTYMLEESSKRQLQVESRKMLERIRQ